MTRSTIKRTISSSLGASLAVAVLGALALASRAAGADPQPGVPEPSPSDAPVAAPADVAVPDAAATEANSGTSCGQACSKSSCCRPKRCCRPRRVRRSCCCCPCPSSCQTSAPVAAAPPRREKLRVIAVAEQKSSESDAPAWRSLFDGKTLDGWKSINFGGEGEVVVENGSIVMRSGSSMTGVVYTGQVPSTNYELELEGQRLQGVDFFATTTFPVGKDRCSFVTGGWGGTVVGLSTVDYYDASDNATSSFFDFKDKTWYRFRVRVSDAKIETWINDKQIVSQPRKGHKIGIRLECDLVKPLGVCTWDTTGAIRAVRIRDLKPAEVEEAAKEVEEQK